MKKVKKYGALFLAFVMAAVSLSACGSSNKESTTAATSAATTAAASETTAADTSADPTEAVEDFSGQTLVVANWKGYGSDAEYGAKAFEEKYGCKVEHQYFTSLEEMITMLKQGGQGKIDVVLPNSTYVKVMTDQDLLEPIDTSKLSTFADLREDLRDFSDSVIDGQYYAIPWTWGTTSLGYNPEAFSEPITSWSALWDSANKGKVGMFDEFDSAILTAGIYTGQEDLWNPNLDEIKTALLELKANTRTFWASYDDFLKPYMSGEITLGNMWAGTASQLLSSGEPVEYIYPEEGTIAWCDFWGIAKDAPNYDLALKWIEFMTDDEFQYAFATDENAHNPVNTAVEASLTDDQKKILWMYPEGPSKIYMQKYMPEETRSQWLELWNEVKAN